MNVPMKKGTIVNFSESLPAPHIVRSIELAGLGKFATAASFVAVMHIVALESSDT